MRLRTHIVAAAGALALAPVAPAAPPEAVSLDYCADQYVLALADRDQIRALSPEADRDYSALRADAAGLPQVRALAEDVLALEPDLVVRSYGGGPRARAFYDRIGVEIVQIDYAADFDDIRANIRAVAAALDQEARGEALIAEMDATLAEAGRSGGAARTALYLTASGATTGSGTIMHEVLEAAGFENALGDAEGWRMLPLERLVLDPPETIVTGFFDTLATQSDAWSYARHGALRALMDDAETAHLSGAQIGCTSWLLAEAALDARRQVENRRVAAAP